MDAEPKCGQDVVIEEMRIDVPLPGKVELRPFRLEDVEHLFALIDRNRDHLSQFGDPTARKYPDLESLRQSIIDPPNPRRIRLGIWDGETVVGTINLTPRDRGGMTIGYWLGQEHTGQGYITEAARAAIEFAKDELGVCRFYADTHPDNTDSQAVMKRLGFGQINSTEEEITFAFGV